MVKPIDAVDEYARQDVDNLDASRVLYAVLL
jgi:hypothetical protein